MPLSYEQNAFIGPFIGRILTAMVQRKGITSETWEKAESSLCCMFVGMYRKIPDSVRLRCGLAEINVSTQTLLTAQDNEFTVSFTDTAHFTDTEQALKQKLDLRQGETFGLVLTIDGRWKIDAAIPARPETMFGAETWTKVATNSIGSASQCNRCGVPAEMATLRSCAGCHLAKYCSVSCQKLAWPVHKPLCKAKIIDLRGLDARLVALRFAHMTSETVDVCMGPSQATISVSTDSVCIRGKSKKYLSISKTEKPIVNALLGVAKHMKRYLCTSDERVTCTKEWEAYEEGSYVHMSSL